MPGRVDQVSGKRGGLNGSVQHLPLSEGHYVLCQGRSGSHEITAGPQIPTLDRRSALQGVFVCPNH